MTRIFQKLFIAMAAITLGIGAAHAVEYRLSSDGTCGALCEVDGIKTINTSTGFSANLYAVVPSSPTLVIELDGQRCYGDLAPNEGPGINIQQPNGSIYHTKVPEPCPEPVFFVTPETSGTTFYLRISAAGTYYVYWGDGTVETIKKTGIGNSSYSHK